MAVQLLLVLPVLLEAQFFFWSMLFLDLVGVDGLLSRDISVDFLHHRVIGVLALVVNPQLRGEDARWKVLSKVLGADLCLPSTLSDEDAVFDFLRSVR